MPAPNIGPEITPVSTSPFSPHSGRLHDPLRGGQEAANVKFFGIPVLGSLLYYIPRYVRARRGINVSFVYKELPPG
jgi:hypothetical protein